MLLTYEQAVALLPEGGEIHTFRNPGAGMLIGADWARDDILAELHDADEILTTGPAARGVGHGIATVKDGRYLFIKANIEAVDALDPPEVAA